VRRERDFIHCLGGLSAAIKAAPPEEFEMDAFSQDTYSTVEPIDARRRGGMQTIGGLR
jgi:hypothetical protein